jgi:hypothetical protein
MLRYTINVGLEASSRFPEQDRLHEADIRERCGRVIHGKSWAIRQSGTERTLVVEFDHHPMHRDYARGEVFSAALIGTLYNLAEDTQQDCIALLIERLDAGGNVILTQCKLIGPAAWHWQPADPAKVLRLFP